PQNRSPFSGQAGVCSEHRHKSPPATIGSKQSSFWLPSSKKAQNRLLPVPVGQASLGLHFDKVENECSGISRKNRSAVSGQRICLEILRKTDLPCHSPDQANAGVRVCHP